MTTSTPSSQATAQRRGLAVFPIPPGRREAPPGWHARASTDPGQPWPPGSNVGVGCRASRIVVVDLDRKNGVDGVATLEQLCAGHGQPWPATFTVATAHAGLHLYYAAPPDRVVASSIGRLGPGIDIRAPGRRFGGYVIGPGSVVDGRPYTVTVDQPIASLPSWLLRLLCPPTSRPRLGVKTGDVHLGRGRSGSARPPERT